MSTQEASDLYFSEVEVLDEENGKKRQFSNVVYETLSKHLNVVQLYMRRKAYIMEQKRGALSEVLERFIGLTKTVSAEDKRSYRNENI